MSMKATEQKIVTQDKVSHKMSRSEGDSLFPRLPSHGLAACTPGRGLQLALLGHLLLKALCQLLHLGHRLLVVLLHALKVPAAARVLPLDSSSSKE